MRHIESAQRRRDVRARVARFDGYPATEFRGNIDLPSTPEDEL